MIDWNKRNGGFLAPESVYEDQLSNLSMQIKQLEKQLNKQKEVLDKIKEWKKQNLFELNRQYKTFEYWEELFEDLDKLLEEIENE